LPSGNVVSITAPAWVLQIPGGLNDGAVPSDFLGRGRTPYYIAPSLGVTNLDLISGGLVNLTIHGGHITEIDALVQP
jgi:hypothetical protein